MMHLHRISACEYITDLSGHGARLYGARWNEKGTSMVYFASSRPLAVLEVLVHLRPDQLERAYCTGVFEAPADSILTLDEYLLPKGWNKMYSAHELKAIGNDFIKQGKYLFMKVPSAIVEESYNFLMNPNHADARHVKLVQQVPFSFDQRLIKS